MTATPTLRRLIDLPGIDALELKALMKPRAADPDELYDFPEIAEAIDATARAAFGLTPDEAARRLREFGPNRIASPAPRPRGSWTAARRSRTPSALPVVPLQVPPGVMTVADMPPPPVRS